VSEDSGINSADLAELFQALPHQQNKKSSQKK
jgi:hypothetical protein